MNLDKNFSLLITKNQDPYQDSDVQYTSEIYKTSDKKLEVHEKHRHENPDSSEV